MIGGLADDGFTDSMAIVGRLTTGVRKMFSTLLYNSLLGTKVPDKEL